MFSLKRIDCVVFLFLPLSIFSLTRDVSSITDALTSPAPAGSLRAAIDDINAAPDASNQITFSTTGTITLAGPLPPITLGGDGVTLDIAGPGIGSMTIDGSDLYRAFFIYQGDVTINGFTLSSCSGAGGDGGTGNSGGSGGGGGLGAGGGLFVNAGGGVNASASISNISFSSCSAFGGDGGDSTAATINRGAGGGGGIGGDGGNENNNTGVGGGGGYWGNGGNASSSVSEIGGTGGGGVFGNGGTLTSGNSDGGSGGGGRFPGEDGLASSTASPSLGGAGGGTAGGAGGASDGAAGAAGGANSGGGGAAEKTAGGGAAGNGGAGGFGGGGGGGGVLSSGTNAGNGGDGGILAGGGGSGGGFNFQGGNGGAGGEFGGGGGSGRNVVAGAANNNSGGTGGFGGGGGGQGFVTDPGTSGGGDGGFGGGGGGGGMVGSSGTTSGGAGAGGGGNGSDGTTTGYGVGGGGSAFGGSIFIREGASLVIGDGVSFTGGSVTAGSAGGVGAGEGSTAGIDIFLDDDASLTFNLSSSSLTISNPIENYTNAGVSGGITKLGSNTLTLSAANQYTGGTTLTAGTLSLQNNAALGTNALSMADTTTLALGSSISISNNISILGTDTFNVASGTGTVSGVISSTGALSKTGAGTLGLSGANTYSGGTTLSAGIISLSNNTGLGTGALSMVDTTTLTLGSSISASNNISIAGTSTVDISSGTGTLSGVISSTGLLSKTGAGTLTLSGVNTYTGGSAVAAGTLALTGSGTAGNGGAISVTGTFDISGVTTSASTGDLSGSGTITLGNKALTISQAGSTTFSGAIGGTGSFIKSNTGTLILTGSNTYSGGTTVSAGTLQGNVTSLPGDFLNNGTLIFNQTSAGSYDDEITGTGDLSVQGGGLLEFSSLSTVTQDTCTVSSGGELAVNGTIIVAGAGASPFLVDSGGSLQGTGPILGNTTVSGTVNPGNSIGTLNIIGDYVQGTGSTLEIEVSPTSGLADLLNVTGNVTIESGATLSVLPEFGEYSANSVYTIISTGGTLSGAFSTATSSLPTLDFRLVYNPGSLQLILNLAPFSSLSLSSNAKILATCLDQSSPLEGSDLFFIDSALRFMSVFQLNSALNQMVPALFSNLDLSLQANLIQVRESLSKQMNLFCRKTCKDLKVVRIWNDFLSQSASQNSQSFFPGYRLFSKGDMLGFDKRISDTSYIGMGFSYLNSPVYFEMNQGRAHTKNMYGCLYGGGLIYSSERNHVYMQTALIGSYSFLKSLRQINFIGEGFSDFSRRAKGKTRALSGLAHLEMGSIFYKENRYTYLRPFCSVDYMFTHRDKFQETGADSVNLVALSHNADLLRSEIGVEVLNCFSFENGSWIPSLMLGGAFENRFIGKGQKGSLTSLSCLMDVEGLFPNRALFVVEANLSGQIVEELITLNGHIRNEWNEDYKDLSWSVELRFGF